MKLIIKLLKIIFNDQINAVTGLIKFYAYAGLFLIGCIISLVLAGLYYLIF